MIPRKCMLDILIMSYLITNNLVLNSVNNDYLIITIFRRLKNASFFSYCSGHQRNFFRLQWNKTITPNFTIVSLHCLTEKSATDLIYINLFFYEQFPFFFMKENSYIMDTQMQMRCTMMTNNDKPYSSQVTRKVAGVQIIS